VAQAAFKAQEELEEDNSDRELLIGELIVEN